MTASPIAAAVMVWPFTAVVVVIWPVEVGEEMGTVETSPLGDWMTCPADARLRTSPADRVSEGPPMLRVCEPTTAAEMSAGALSGLHPAAAALIPWSLVPDMVVGVMATSWPPMLTVVPTGALSLAATAWGVYVVAALTPAVGFETTTPEGPSETTWFETVTGAPPSEAVWSPMTTLDASGATDTRLDPTVATMLDAAGVAEFGLVSDPSKMLDAPDAIRLTFEPASATIPPVEDGGSRSLTDDGS